MSIKGLTTLSLVDWDGVVCATVFVGGCNFRCPWCQNAPLVIPSNKIKIGTIYPEKLLQDIEGLGKYIEGICISGGEPTFNQDLCKLLEGIKKLGLKTKLDTNGSRPDVIFELLNRELVDYYAMDIKAPFVTEKYSKVTGCKFRDEWLTMFLDSISLIMKAAPDYEFRTTVVPTLHTVKDIEQIAKYAIKGAKKYVIQNFWNAGELINKRYANVQSFNRTELEAFAEAAKPYIKEVKIRDVSHKS